MIPNKNNTLIAFLLGTALGTTIGMIITALFSPYSGEETRERIKTQSLALKDRAVMESDEFAARIHGATDEWLSHMQTVADDLVSQGKLTAGDARVQIDTILAKVRG